MRVLLSVVILVALIAANLHNAFAVQVFDDFSAPRLSAEKWNPYKTIDWFEEVREVQNGKFVSKLSGSCDNWLSIMNRLYVKNPSTVNSISVKAQLLEGEASDGTLVGPTIEGHFYAESGGDVWAAITLGYAGNNYSINYGINTSSGWITGTPFSLSVEPNVEYTLKIEYDGNNQFTFSVNNESHTVTGPAKTGDPGSDYKSLTSRISGPGVLDCTGYVNSTFDDLMINDTLYDDFEAAPLSSSLYDSYEVVREVRDGKLNMNVQNHGTSRNTVDIYVDENYVTDYFQSDVTLGTETSTNGPNTYGEARVYGAFYNSKYDGSSGYNGEDGEIYGVSRVRRYADSTVKASALIWICEDSSCNTVSDVFFRDFQCPVSLGTTVTLSVEKINNGLAFGCNDEIIDYTFASPLYSPNNNMRKLRARLYSSTGENGYLYTTFDNVFTQKYFPWNLMLSPIIHGVEK